MFAGSKKIAAGVLAGAIALALGSTGFAQYAPQPTITYVPTYSTVPAPPVAPYTEPQPVTYTADQLDQLLAPIALYPDPLLAQVLAAATYPQDIASAAQWLQTYPTPTDDQINAQPWDPSVKALVHFPSVLDMMANQMDWTEALGTAFANQQSDVMDSVQRLRTQAIQANTLASNPQEQVISDNGEIEILPAQPDEIYIPSYNPDLVYAPGGYIDWGTAFYIGGPWFDLGWDWHGHHIDRDYRWDWNDWQHPHVDTHPQAWVHDRARPIPAPHVTNVRPHGIEPARGWDHAAGHQPGPAFNPQYVPHSGAAPKQMRPVNGIAPHPAPPAPHPAPAATPHVEVPHFTPPAAPSHAVEAHPATPPVKERPVEGLPHPAPIEPPHAVEPPHPVAPPHPVEPPHAVEPPRPVAPPHPVEPPHPVAPPRVETPHVAPPPAPAAHEAPPAFHVEPGANVHADSSRGNASQGRH